MIRILEPTLRPTESNGFGHDTPAIIPGSIRYEVTKAQLDLNVNRTHLCKLLPQLLKCITAPRCPTCSGNLLRSGGTCMAREDALIHCGVEPGHSLRQP